MSEPTTISIEQITARLASLGSDELLAHLDRLEEDARIVRGLLALARARVRNARRMLLPSERKKDAV